MRQNDVTADLLAPPPSPLALYKQDTIARLRVAEARLVQYEQTSHTHTPPNHLQNVRRLTEDIRILKARRSQIEDDLRRSISFYILELDMRIVAEQLACLAFERFQKINANGTRYH